MKKLIIIAGLLMYALIAQAQQIQQVSLNFSWDRNIETNINHYRLHTGRSSRVYTNVVNVGNVTNYTRPNVALGQPFFFALTAVNNQGIESDYSSEIFFTTPSKPSAPLGLRIENIVINGTFSITNSP